MDVDSDLMTKVRLCVCVCNHGDNKIWALSLSNTFKFNRDH